MELGVTMAYKMMGMVGGMVEEKARMELGVTMAYKMMGMVGGMVEEKARMESDMGILEMMELDEGVAVQMM
jgi:hypothetical protein